MSYLWNIVAESRGPSPLTQTTDDGIALHESVKAMPGLPLGPFVRLGDGEVMAMDETCVVVSSDDGVTWSTLAEQPLGEGMKVCPERAMTRTRSGAIVLAWENKPDQHWTWSDDLKDAPGARMPTYTARSLDGGHSWQDIQKLHDEWTGAIRDIKQLQSGRVVFTTMKMFSHPGRHTVLTYASDDDGVTWIPSNILDLGGHGHHGGVTESTIIELDDERVLMYLRTNWGQFWRAESCDGARSWHPLGPAGVDASSAPGLLFRTSSGRIALLWNRLLPEGEDHHPLRGGDRLWSATPVSNFRAELSLAFSNDQCESWSAPIVIARKDDTWLAYPYAFEAQPGVLWVTTMQGGLRVRLHEGDFV